MSRRYLPNGAILLEPDPAILAAISAHAGLSDPHPGYATDTDLSTHAAASDPHTGYVLESAMVIADWTPALTAATTNPNLGSTGTATGRYLLMPGKLVWASFRFEFAGTGISAGSGQWFLSYPVTPAARYGGNEQIGNIRYNITGGATIGTLEYETDTTVQLAYYNDPASGAGPIAVAGFSSTTGAGVVATNWIDGFMIYEAA